MLKLVVAALAQFGAQTSADSTYSSPAVRSLVERAVVANRRVPDSLRAYRARVESEMAFVARQPDATEQTFAVEQTESVVRWQRPGLFEQRVIGYRSQSIGVTVSAVGMFRQAWTVPILYGNRISLLFGQVDSASRRRAQRRRRADTTVVVHPFADDHGSVYRYTGGDTVVTINPGGRDIPVVRIHVEPTGNGLTRRTVAFRGDVELDAQRAQIVRMRGYFVTVGPKRKTRTRLFTSQFEAIAYVELENGEFEQRYWLPVYQRIEAQAAIALLGDQRAVFRVISRFRGMTVNPRDSVSIAAGAPLGTDSVSGNPVTADSAIVAGTSPVGSDRDTLRLTLHRLTFAPSDSIDRYAEWSRGIGELTGAVRADDFTDVAPDSWRPTGRPFARIRFEQPSDLAHYNRVEGVYTGVAGEAKLRDAAPGLVARAALGWAWAENTARGRVTVERQVGLWWPMLRFSRSLDLTNDFREPVDSGSTLGALFSVDDYDYVDRHTAVGGLTGFLNHRRTVRVRVEVGVGSDRYSAARRARGPLAPGDSGFRFNRGVDAGRYRVAAVKLEVHPDVNAAFVRPGVGAVVQAQVASGDLAWQRAEVRLVGRRAIGPLIYAVQFDAGLVTGDSIPPQQLFELGENQNLPGYGYKEFAGNRAAVVRGLVMYPLPLWRTPLRFRRWVFPAIAPNVSFGAQSGWAEATTNAARSSISRLGTVGDSVFGLPGSVPGTPVSRPTEGIKSTIDFRLRFFGGAISVGVARATDHHEAWRFVAGFAQIL
jgi:hypothetical protein